MHGRSLRVKRALRSATDRYCAMLLTHVRTAHSVTPCFRAVARLLPVRIASSATSTLNAMVYDPRPKYVQ